MSFYITCLLYRSGLRYIRLKVCRFQWVACQIDVLENCLDYPELQRALNSLPDTLDQTYTRILNGIPAGHKEKAIRILQFLAFPERPLLMEEAVEAIAVSLDSNPRFDPRNRMPEPREISRYCSSLVVVVRRTRSKLDREKKIEELQLAHFSVKEFLQSDRLINDLTMNFSEINARASIAKVCLAYLLQFNQEISTESIRDSFPLAMYCAYYWMDHAVIAESSDAVLQQFIKKLFLDYGRQYINCCRLYNHDTQQNSAFQLREDISIPPALYYASSGGLKTAVKVLTDSDIDVDAQGGYCYALWTPWMNAQKIRFEI